MTAIYMYHAVGNKKQTEGADPYYTVTSENFSKQLARIPKSIPIANQIIKSKSIKDHCITFDDGHISNFSVAFPMLVENSLLAEFYVNTSTIGKKSYISWLQLQEMTNSGMTIQSHGHNHFYFSDLSNKEIYSELDRSKKMIEDKLGNEVVVFAPPGGRFDNRVVKISNDLAYKCLATSIPGTVIKSRGGIVPRFSVLSKTPNKTISDWQRSFSYSTNFERVKYRLLRTTKILLGNTRYEQLRSGVLGSDSEKNK